MAQNEMFGFEGVDAEDLLDQLGKDYDDNNTRWPVRLVEFVDIGVALYNRLGLSEDEARRYSIAFIAELAHWAGGRMFYLPKDKRLRIALRDKQIFDAYPQVGMDELQRRYELTDVQIWNIIRQQRALHIKRVQRNLFTDDN